MPTIPRQLYLDFGDDLRALFTRVVPLVLASAWQDASETLTLDLAFTLDNPLIQDVLDEIGRRVQGIVDTTRDEIQALIGEQAANGWSIDELADRIAELAEIRSPARAELIARTETAHAYSRGSLAAYQDSGVVAGVEWLTTDPCEQCAPLDGRIVPLGEAFADGILHPPAHPACRCALAPVIGG